MYQQKLPPKFLRFFVLIEILAREFLTQRRNYSNEVYWIIAKPTSCFFQRFLIFGLLCNPLSVLCLNCIMKSVKLEIPSCLIIYSPLRATHLFSWHLKQGEKRKTKFHHMPSILRSLMFVQHHCAHVLITFSWKLLL